MPVTAMTDGGGGLPTYSPRFTQPSSSSTYYSSGNPFKGDLSMWAGGNCTAYAWGRFHEIMGQTSDAPNCYLGRGNAENWYSQTYGYSKGSTPKLGAVLCLRDGPFSGLGHVAIVEEISNDGKTIKTSESGYNAYVFKVVERHYPNWNDAGYGFQGFIYNPKVFKGSSSALAEEETGSFIDFQKRASKLSSSDSYSFISASPSVDVSQLSSVQTFKNTINNATNNFTSAIENVTNAIRNSVSLVTQVALDTIASKLASTIKATPKIIKRQSLLSISDNTVESPFIELEIGGYKIGSYKNDLDIYPNYVSGLQVFRQNGIINQYTITLVHQIRLGEDPNLLDELFSTVNYDKIKIKYGDSNSGQYFQDINAMITNVVMNRNYTAMSITYTIEATSEGELIKTYTTNFPAVTDRPSSVLRNIIYNNSQTSPIILEAFPGMKNRTFVESNGLLPSNDCVVDIEAQSNAHIIDYINYLVGCMSNQVYQENVLRESVYYSTFVDNDPTNPDGAYIKVTEVSANVDPRKITDRIYNITVGYPKDIVYNFSVDTTQAWELLYKNNQKAVEYYYTITNNGDLTKQYSPSLVSNTNVLSEVNKNWWTQMIKFPITAQLTIKGLLTPVMLMDYINVNVVFYGQQHITSGIYAITGQTDSLSGTGYRTTLSLVRVGNL